MRNPCEHILPMTLTWPGDHTHIQWCDLCGATRIKQVNTYEYARWSSPRLAKEGHSEQCRDYED